jgi:uncharacterized membrane protein (UPF0127 family)
MLMAVSIDDTDKLRNPGIAGIITLVIVLVVGTFFFTFWPSLSKTDLILGDGVFKASLALDDQSRQQGLSGTDSIANNEALVMAFPADDRYGIWMKDMNYPIDIVWLDSNKRVIDLVKNVSPDESTTVVHKPKSPARYVVELKAGTVNNKAIHINSKATFQINSEIK